MSASLPRKHGRPHHAHAVAVRRAPENGHFGGYLYCDGCGAASVTKGDFALAAGVSMYQLNQWLNKQPMRADVAARLRRSVLRVEE